MAHSLTARMFAGLVALVIAGCSTPPAGPLDPFEVETLPEPFDLLDLDPGRDWVFLAQIPAPVPFDLSSQEAARASLARLVAEPWRILRAGTALGHVMVGWSCSDGHRGLTSKTGGNSLAIPTLLSGGWGLSAALSTYLDGHLVPVDDLSPGHLAILSEGRGHLMAAEVTAADCGRLRAALETYRTHPDRPESRFRLLGPVTEMQGDGCIGFALYLAGTGGLLPGLGPALSREVPLSSAYVGTGSTVPAGVEPYRPVAADGTCPGPVEFPDLLAGPWEGGTPLGTVTVPDPELLFAGIVALRRAAGLAPTWVDRRALGQDDPAVARASTAMLDWARGYPVWRIQRRGRIEAIVLERRVPPG